MKKYYKVTQPNGFSFFPSPNGKYPKYEVGRTVAIPEHRQIPKPYLRSPYVLHASDCIGEALLSGLWPCRLFEVQGTPVVPPEHHTHGFVKLSVIQELPNWQALGQNGQECIRFLKELSSLSREDFGSINAVYQKISTKSQQQQEVKKIAELAAFESKYYFGQRAIIRAAEVIIRQRGNDMIWEKEGPYGLRAMFGAYVAVSSAALALSVKKLIRKADFIELYEPFIQALPLFSTKG